MIMPKSKQVQLAFGMSITLSTDTLLNQLGVFSNDRYVNYFGYLFKFMKVEMISNNAPSFMQTDQVNKILEILVHLNNASLARFYVVNIMNALNAKQCSKLASLIKHFEVECKSEFFLIDFFKPNNRQNISVNCHLVQVSINSNLKIYFCISISQPN